MKLGSWTAAGLLAMMTLATPVPTSAADVALIGTRDESVYFSPDDDGRRDVARVKFWVYQDDTRITASVWLGGMLVLGSVDLGRLQQGQHEWRWDGSGASGRTVRDGTFLVMLRASRRGATDKAKTAVVMDRTADDGHVVSSRTTIYPKATLVHDAVVITYRREGWRRLESAVNTSDETPPLRARLVVRDDQGARVWRDSQIGDYEPAFVWDARRAAGSAVSPGAYVARLRILDAFGNRTTRTVSLQVSGGQLAERVWSTTVAAGSAAEFVVPTPPGCNSCGEGCSPVPSLRFAGGLSFPDCLGLDYLSTYQWFQARPDVVAAPVDAYRVTATGGPTVPGSPDVGLLGVVNGSTTVGPGDVAAMTDWSPVDLDGYPFLPDGRTVLPWVFATSELNSYDVATFTVEYRHWAPVRARGPDDRTKHRSRASHRP